MDVSARAQAEISYQPGAALQHPHRPFCRRHSIARHMRIKILILIAWLVVAFVVNDDTSFRDWSIGLVSGVFLADIVLTKERRSHG